MIFVYHVGLYYIVTLSSVVRSVDSHIVPFSFLFFFTFFNDHLFLFSGDSPVFLCPVPKMSSFYRTFKTLLKYTAGSHCSQAIHSLKIHGQPAVIKKREREKKENVLSECFWLIYPDFWDIITRCNVFRIFLYFYFILIGMLESCAYLNNGFL